MIEFLDGIVWPIFSTENWDVFTWIVGILVMFYLLAANQQTILAKSHGVARALTLVFAILVTLYIGCRPLKCYADTGLYTTIFRLLQQGYWHELPAAESEGFFKWLELFCIEVTTASGWLLAVTVFYIAGMALAARLWTPNAFFLMFFMLLVNYSFWGYATNGIRNGMATSLVMAGMAVLVNDKAQTLWRGRPLAVIVAAVLILLGFRTHSSVIMTIAGIVAALCVRSTKTATWIWVGCVVVAAGAGHSFEGIFSSLSDDGRLSYYSQSDSMDQFTRTGYRWDFILYSAVPIVVGWYAIVKRHIVDRTYSFILNTYIYTNAIWVLINQIAFSNRFAYLSWFLYPVVLFYPYLRLSLGKNQGRVAALLLLICMIFNMIF